jgi:hypothetical protein
VNAARFCTLVGGFGARPGQMFPAPGAGLCGPVCRNLSRG